MAARFDPPAGLDEQDVHERVAQRAATSVDGFPAGPGLEVRFLGPELGRRHHFLAPLYARAVASEPLTDASAVLSLGGMAWTLAAQVAPGARHLGYVGVPRPLYGHAREYLREYPHSLRPLIRAAIPALRSHHRTLLRRPHRLVTNSHASAATLSRIGRRPVDVVYPPVRTSFFTPDDSDKRHYLAVSRLRAHKRLEVVIEAFRRTGEPLVIAGDGPWQSQLRALAPPNVHFAGPVGDEELRTLYRSSRALVSASVEEFGICLAEAQSAGVPVVAPRAGGSGEIVLDGETGVLLDAVEPGEIVRALRQVEQRGVDPEACRRSAERFSEERFLAEVDELLAGSPTSG
jgi:glycosyltransferase involved in cell wall biosynthesis